MKRNLSFEILFSLGLLLSASGSAIAGVSGALTVVATPLASNVTYSDTFQSTNRRKVTTTSVLDSFVVYGVTITNVATNTVNNIVFKGTTTVDVIANGKPLAATYDSVESPDGMISCDTVGDTTVSCSIGQLRSDGSVTFWLYFKAPKNENDVDPAQPDELVDFSYWVLFSEGGNDSSDNPNDSSAVKDAVAVWLGTPNPMLVISGVPSAKKVTLFSGNGLFAEPELKSSNGSVVSPAAQTNVTIPAGASAASTGINPTATIAQIPITGSGCKHFVTCYESNLTIPTVDTGADAPGGLFLSILVRIDASNLVKGLKFSDIQPVYIDDSGERDVYKCIVLDGKYTALPCWTDGNQVKNPQDPNEDGDVYWLFINNKNGGYKFL